MKWISPFAEADLIFLVFFDIENLPALISSKSSHLCFFDGKYVLKQGKISNKAKIEASISYINKNHSSFLDTSKLVFIISLAE
jgi:hypothetical protein